MVLYFDCRSLSRGSSPPYSYINKVIHIIKLIINFNTNKKISIFLLCCFLAIYIFVTQIGVHLIFIFFLFFNY
jgi:hypothetical protein